MCPERLQFLNLREKPARFNVEEAAMFLGFSAHDIPILIGRGLLKPLANPPANATKYFARVELEGLRDDVKWLARATAVIHQHWRLKNDRKAKRHDPGGLGGFIADRGAA